jgi:diguanylate cyclase (GGDEF)-like protein
MFAHEQELARVDGLTGIYNRRYFFELATREFSATIRYQRPLTIILFDIDDFKLVNDNFGHAYGDTILIQIAQIAIAQVRDVDVLARYGGDEFIILLPETDSEHAFIIAERIRESVASTNVGPFIITLSIGVAETVHAPQDQLVEDIIRRADKALYLAKQKGRNNTVIFTEL